MSERPRTRRPIECQVVRLLSDRDLVIDAGENEGVRRGMTFRIMGQTVIVDPDSDEIIETIEYEKIRVKVSYVGDEVSVARTFTTTDSPASSFLRELQRPWYSTTGARRDPDWDRSVEVRDVAIEIIEDIQQEHMESHAVNTRQGARWMLTFGHPEGGSHTEPNFPNFEFWHTNKNACISEGERVLKVLALRGDKREWYAAGFPDPFMVGSGRHPADSWFISISNLP